MRLLAALGCAGLAFKAFSHADLRGVRVDRFGAEAAHVTPARLRYQLTSLVGSLHRLDRALLDLNAEFDHLAELSGLSVAACIGQEIQEDLLDFSLVASNRGQAHSRSRPRAVASTWARP
jgi:hypothetical protein